MKKMLLALTVSVMAFSSAVMASGHSFRCEMVTEGYYQRIDEIFGHGEIVLEPEIKELDKLFINQTECESSSGQACEITDRAVSAKVCAEMGGDQLSSGECARCYSN